MAQMLQAQMVQYMIQRISLMKIGIGLCKQRLIYF